MAERRHDSHQIASAALGFCLWLPFGLVVCSDGVLTADVDATTGKVDILPAQAKRFAAPHAVYQLEQHNDIELAVMLSEPHQQSLLPVPAGGAVFSCWNLSECVLSCLTGKFNFQRAAVRSGRRLFALHSFREGRWSYGNILGVVSMLSCAHRICRSDYSDLQKKMTAQPEKLAVI